MVFRIECVFRKIPLKHLSVVSSMDLNLHGNFIRCLVHKTVVTVVFSKVFPTSVFAIQFLITF